MFASDFPRSRTELPKGALFCSIIQTVPFRRNRYAKTNILDTITRTVNQNLRPFFCCFAGGFFFLSDTRAGD
jgi:hypothetical protein